MFSKRPDKYTTGLINMRNDCFANSSLQAYSSLPGLTEYLNSFMKSFSSFQKILKKYEINIDKVIPDGVLINASKAKFNRKREKDNSPPASELIQINLHLALAKMVKKLQETQLASHTISVWVFLHELERIYDAKISRSQHDAHELTQLINETLENENLNCIKASRYVNEYLILNKIKTSAAIEFPEFPFSGLMLSQMKCLSCHHLSKPTFGPFLMLTLHPPQTTATDLDTLLDENEAETISGYNCLKCRIRKICETEGTLESENSNDTEFVEAIKGLDKNPNLFINEDIDPALEEFIKSYNKGGIDMSSVTSSVFRKTNILKPPRIFGLHLSRSTFDARGISRNPCRVRFNDRLDLSIGQEYLEELQAFQESAQNVSHVSPEFRVLTTDVDDMEDESVQREDVDENGSLDDKQGSDGESSDETEEDTSLDDDQDSLSSQDTIPHSSSTDNTSKGMGEAKVDTLNNAPISQDQTLSLQRHFRQFKFDENNTYKYRLRAVIRHQGSHTQGHYECFKRKPLFVKDNDGKIVKLSPEIDTSPLEDLDEVDEEDDEDDFKSSFRGKLSSMMGRRPSISQVDPTRSNLQEVADSALATPAEVFVDREDYFSSMVPSESHLLLPKPAPLKAEQPRMKLQKIPSVIKHPFWRVGDSKVSEVTKSAVLYETGTVYMLYYERVLRKPASTSK